MIPWADMNNTVNRLNERNSERVLTNIREWIRILRGKYIEIAISSLDSKDKPPHYEMYITAIIRNRLAQDLQIRKHTFR
jgi:hypothetical protein